MSVVKYNKVNYELEWGKVYNFYGNDVKLLDVRKRQGTTLFRYLTGECKGMVHECEIEEFALQNPDIVLKKGEEKGKEKWVYTLDEEGY